MNHTPGPWNLIEDGTIRATSQAGKSDQMADYRGAVISDMNAGLHGTETPWNCQGREHARPETVANARLIAAAPELLDALILALPYVESETDNPAYKRGAVAKIVSELRAVIEKAGGM